MDADRTVVEAAGVISTRFGVAAQSELPGVTWTAKPCRPWAPRHRRLTNWFSGLQLRLLALLERPHRGVGAIAAEQFGVLAALDHAPAIKYQDLICIHDRR